MAVLSYFLRNLITNLLLRFAKSVVPSVDDRYVSSFGTHLKHWAGSKHVNTLRLSVSDAIAACCGVQRRKQKLQQTVCELV